MFAPGCVALAVSVLVLIFFKDTPESSGFPAIDAGSKKPVAKDTKESSGILPDPLSPMGLRVLYQCGDATNSERIVAWKGHVQQTFALASLSRPHQFFGRHTGSVLLCWGLNCLRS